MAKLWIREYQDSANAGAGRAVPLAFEPGTDQTPVTFSTSTQSAAFAATTRFITVTADAAFHYVVGANPTATTNAMKVPADTPWSIGVKAGQKIAVIAAS
jgi:hypothetical protein